MDEAGKRRATWRERALEKWYLSRPGWTDGTTEFHDWIAEGASPEGTCLEIGPGPDNETSRILAAHFGAVDGLDVDPGIRSNPSLREAHVYDGTRFPLPGGTYDCAVANYVLEHVRYAQLFTSEVARALRPGGRFYFRTPNLCHYVSLFSRLTPHLIHERLANRLRGTGRGSRDIYPTYYRMNTRCRLRRLAAEAGFSPVILRTVEKEPSYGMATRLMFYPCLAYERLVNRLGILEDFRANIFGLFRKPGGENEEWPTGQSS